MKFVCLAYHNEQKWAETTEAERKSRMETCFAYEDELSRGGHSFVHGAALQLSCNAATVCWQGGKAVMTDGPYAETKEQIGGFGYLEARDLNHAIQLMSKHPAIRWCTFEIRPAHEEMNALVEARGKLVEARSK
jgi:hypothetical protein